jgi:hypothetical protein
MDEAKMQKITNLKSGIFGILFLTALVLLLVTACAPQNVYVCSDGRQVNSPGLCQAEQDETIDDENVDDAMKEPSKNLVEPQEASKDKPMQKNFDAATKALIDKTSAVKNIKFSYFRSDDAVSKNYYYVSGARMKVELTQKYRFTKEEPYDTIYLNYDTKTATGYCERQSQSTCTPLDQAYQVDFENYRIATPYTWLSLMETGRATNRTKRIDGRQVVEVSFKSEGVDGNIWLDSFFGVPLEILFNGIVYKYENMLINNAKETDFSHQPYFKEKY